VGRDLGPRGQFGPKGSYFGGKQEWKGVLNLQFYFGVGIEFPLEV